MTLSELLRDSLSDALGQTEKVVEPELVTPGFSSEEVKKLSSFLEDFASKYGELVETFEKGAGLINAYKTFRHGRELDELEGKTPEEIKDLSKSMSKGKGRAVERLARNRATTARSLSRAQGIAHAGKGLGIGSKKMLILAALGTGVGGVLLGSQMQRNKDIRDMQAAMYTQPTGGA